MPVIGIGVEGSQGDAVLICAGEVSEDGRGHSELLLRLDEVTNYKSNLY